MVEAGYLFDAVTVEAIADGHHLPRACCRLIHKVGRNGWLVSAPCVAPACPGRPSGGRRTAGCPGGREWPAFRPGFTGSVCTMDRAVRTAVSAGIPLEDALRMASGTPSKILGTAGRRGAILPGMDADLVRLDGDLNVIMTVVGGTIFAENH